MEILGALVYIAGFLGLGYIIEATRIIESFGDFGGVVFIFAWVGVTMFVGSLLMKIGEMKNGEEEK